MRFADACPQKQTVVNNKCIRLIKMFIAQNKKLQDNHGLHVCGILKISLNPWGQSESLQLTTNMSNVNWRQNKLSCFSEWAENKKYPVLNHNRKRDISQGTCSLWKISRRCSSPRLFKNWLMVMSSRAADTETSVGSQKVVTDKQP